MSATKQIESRDAKLKIIRDAFANQGIRESPMKMSGWTRGEVATYLKLELGIDYTGSNKLTGAEIDLIVENLRAAKMI